jgi:hypothetical protein
MITKICFIGCSFLYNEGQILKLSEHTYTNYMMICAVRPQEITMEFPLSVYVSPFIWDMIFTFSCSVSLTSGVPKVYLSSSN